MSNPLHNNNIKFSQQQQVVNLTKGHIAVTHGWFNGIHQVAQVCTPPKTQMASQSFQPQHTAKCRQACPFPYKLCLHMGRSGLPSNTWFHTITASSV